jgi:hypothetical protein
MQLTDLLKTIEMIDVLRSEGWKVQPPTRKKKAGLISEAMTAPNRKRSLALKRAWKRRKKAA